ncbi:16S rRNA (cytidine(1402)-2'-O)-methyltransferase [Limisalsivibrio acetivorans]|uniref:16S rRNA (cytidine(1402)-2'-O)-methyltransferase n=1 Tax=Limisalsivibrio acetivorans TaxID=1304888 RepID=UPI0003B46B54|nr:SAM-dependent methyltransferase [Limisalsivibrio acetivorans]
MPPFIGDIVAETDFLIGEEKKTCHRFLAAIKLREHPFELINEHSEKEDKKRILDMLKSGKTAALFSDAGTPCVADPGYDFIDACHKANVEILSVPGPSSITAALSVSGFYAEEFAFLGFPPRDKRKRKTFFDALKDRKETLVILERPYALNRFLEELKITNRDISLSISLGMPDERTYRGKSGEILAKLPGKIKAPFVVVVDKV